MVDNKSKTSIIGHIQKNISLMKINNIILVLCTCIILLSSFVIYCFCICYLGSFSMVCHWSSEAGSKDNFLVCFTFISSVVYTRPVCLALFLL